jgi:flagellar biogenesis protein FliO
METFSQSAAVIAVLVLLAATLWTLQRRGLARFSVRPGAERRMQVVERLPLTAQHALHLVRIEGKILLVASAPGGCTVLGPIAEAERPCP